MMDYYNYELNHVREAVFEEDKPTLLHLPDKNYKYHQ